MGTTDRLQALRGVMRERGIDGFIINGMDPHASEYTPARWSSREAISGFTGSYGHVAITADAAALWTDSRYYAQAEIELEGTGIEMLKDRVPETVPYYKWLAAHIGEGGRVAIDGFTLPIVQYKLIIEEFTEHGIELITTEDLLDEVWTGRPEFPSNRAFELINDYVGLSRVEKIEKIRAELELKESDATIITTLDDIAWTLNIRCNDVTFNPVMVSYLWIDDETATLFTQVDKIPSELQTKMASEGIDIVDYNQVDRCLSEKSGYSVWIDDARTNFNIFISIAEANGTLFGLSIPTLLKSVKSPEEIKGMREAHLRDGIAMAEFCHWLDTTIGKKKITELTISKKLKEFRSKQEGFFDISFPSIVSYGEHGGIIHYSVNEKTNIEVKPEGIVLLDSGGQYMCGTTDITRTIALNNPTVEMIRDFTLVLKGMIRLSKAKFPEGTIGCHLDVLAREAMWSYGYNYGHGTSHGVGFFLNVHEGPMSIRQDLNSLPIVPGQVMSNEPGLYRDGEYGIRTENVITCIESSSRGFGKFNRFETLTLCPIDKRLIDRELLSSEELEWLNSYHQDVFCKVSPYVSDEVRVWLEEATCIL